MTDQPPQDTPATPEQAATTKAELMRSDEFVTRWNSGNPIALRQIAGLDSIIVSGAPAGDKPRPPSAGGSGLLTPEQSRQLAQASIDAGGDAAAITAALADTDPDWQPDTRSKSDRAWADDHAVGRPERYQIGNLDRDFRDDIPAEREALADVVRSFVASAGFDRSGGSELAETMTKTMAQLRGQRPEQRAQYQNEQRARLGDKAEALVKDAAKALANVNPDLIAFMHKSGALSNADVIAQLAFMAQARAVRG